jgi:hypothetical protein
MSDNSIDAKLQAEYACVGAAWGRLATAIELAGTAASAMHFDACATTGHPIVV